MKFEALLKDFTTAVESNDAALLGGLFVEDGVYNDGFFGPFRRPEGIGKMLNKHF